MWPVRQSALAGTLPEKDEVPAKGVPPGAARLQAVYILVPESSPCVPGVLASWKTVFRV